MAEFQQSHHSKFHDDPEFQSLLVNCLEALQRGDHVDADAIAADYPRYADEIRRFLGDRELLEGFATEFGTENLAEHDLSAYEPTMDSRSTASGWSAGDTVRYIGEYEILEEIARGGMGIVFKARQQKLKRIVALKMILSGRLADAGDVQRFYREAQAAGRLKHPNIVPVHEVGEHEGRHYFTMDFVDGRSLAEEIRDETLSPREAATMLQTIAQAVHFAHQQGTVHRDLKPANILLTDNGIPHITDFGLAKILESTDEDSRAELTATGQILGTPSYMSPEQASGKQELIGPASDIFSLGSILYACLTGRAPFVADSPVDTLLQVMKKEPVSPRELNPSVPKDLETICLKCLTKEPHKRYGTAQELADDLERFIEGRPVSARPVGQISKSIRWCRRNPAVASLLMLILLSMATGTIVSAYYAYEAKRRASLALAAKQSAEYARDSERKMRKHAESMTKFAMAQQSQAQDARKIAEQRGDDLRRQLYIAHMPQALTAWNNGNAAGTEQLLAQHIPDGDEEDLRGFEWYWLDNLTKSWRLKIQTGRRIIDADVSHDGNALATIGGGRLMVHRLVDGDETHDFSVPNTGQGGVQFNSTGEFIAVGHRRVQVWNVETKQKVWESKADRPIPWVGITPDDRWVVSVVTIWGKGGNSRIRVHDFSSGDLIREIAVPDFVFTAAISPSGDQIAATCFDDRIRIWDLATGIQLKEWEVTGSLNGLTYSPDGRWLTTGTQDGTLSRHDAIEGKRVNVWMQPNSFRRIASDPSGKTLAAAGSPQIAYLLDAETGETTKEFRGHAAEITAIEFRPTVQELVSCDRAGVIHVWDTRDYQGFLRCQGAEIIDLSDAAFSSDMKWFAKSEGISWRREQKGMVRLYHLPSGSAGPVLVGHESGVFGVAIADNRVYSAGHDGKLIAWDLETFSPIDTRDVDEPLTTLAVTGDGSMQAVGTGLGNVLVFSSDQKEKLAEISISKVGPRIEDVALSPGGEFVVGRAPRALRVLDCMSHQMVLEVDGVGVGPVAFSHSGDSLAVSVGDKVRIYSTSTWKIVREFEAHSQPIKGMAYHPDDRRFATRSIDGTIKLWETKTWQNLLSIPISYRNRNDLFAPIFSPDAKYLVVGRDRSDTCLLSATKYPHDQSPDPEILETRATTLARRQLWDEAFQDYQRLFETGSLDLPWAFVHAAEVAALVEQTEATRSRIIGSAKRAKEYEDSDLFLAARLILAAQLRPDTDPNPEQSLRIVKRAWQELEKPTGVSLLYTLFRQGRDQEIVEFRTQHDGIGRSWATNQFLHAGALYRLGEVHKASEILKRAADRYARDMPPLGRGRYIEREGFSGIIWDLLIWREVSDIAKRALDEAIDSNPNDAALLAYRGDLHRRWHRWSDAMDDLGRALQLDPDNADVLEAATTSAILAGEYEVAAQLAELLIDRFQQPDRKESIWLAARIAALVPGDAGIDQSLLKQVRESAAARPRNSWRHIALVGVLHRLGRLDEAIEVLDRIVTAFPDLKPVNKVSLDFRRGLILYDQGKADEAKEVFQVGNAIANSFDQPPGVFPTQGRDVWVDFLALRQELKELLNISEHNETNAKNR